MLSLVIYLFLRSPFRFKLLTPVDQKSCPSLWWRNQCENFPLLAIYIKNNSSFQATSVASERVFAMDTFLLTSLRQSIVTERSSNMVFLMDYLRKRENPEAFRLCEGCPPPPHNDACYKCCCAKHNGTL
jgi:hypothetical protein